MRRVMYATEVCAWLVVALIPTVRHRCRAQMANARIHVPLTDHLAE